MKLNPQEKSVAQAITQVYEAHRLIMLEKLATLLETEVSFEYLPYQFTRDTTAKIPKIRSFYPPEDNHALFLAKLYYTLRDDYPYDILCRRTRKPEYIAGDLTKGLFGTIEHFSTLFSSAATVRDYNSKLYTINQGIQLKNKHRLASQQERLRKPVLLNSTLVLQKIVPLSHIDASATPEIIIQAWKSQFSVDLIAKLSDISLGPDDLSEKFLQSLENTLLRPLICRQMLPDAYSPPTLTLG